MSTYLTVSQPQPTIGSFDYPCSQIAMPLCYLVGSQLQEPLCYARNMELGPALIFEPATLVIYVIALVMTIVMIIHIKAKYTAVGRKEILFFFYLYTAFIVFDFLMISGIIPAANVAFPYLAALHAGLSLATMWALFLNGFVPLQIIEDGTSLSLWTLRISSLVVVLITAFVGIGTNLGLAGMSRSNPILLWILYYIVGGVLFAFYVISQIIVVFTRIDDNWPLVDLGFGVVFFILAQVFNLGLSFTICDMAKHYIDGTFCSSICTLLAVMMVYKYWDSITKEDLEFSVGSKNNKWEVNDPLLGDQAMAALQQQQSSSTTLL